MKIFHNNNMRIFIEVSILISGLILIIWGLIIASLSLIVFGSVVVSSLLFPIVHSIRKSEKIVYNSIDQSKINESYLEPYHSIIIANSTKRSKRVGIFVGIDMLVNRFKSQNCKYKITLCNTPIEVKNEIENLYAEKIYLFGHGFKGGLTFYSDESISEFNYCSIDPSIKKKFIGQFHCNCGGEHSLVELLIKKPKSGNHYLINGFTTTFILWYDIRFKVLKMINKC